MSGEETGSSSRFRFSGRLTSAGDEGGGFSVGIDWSAESWGSIDGVRVCVGGSSAIGGGFEFVGGKQLTSKP